MMRAAYSPDNDLRKVFSPLHEPLVAMALSIGHAYPVVIQFAPMRVTVRMQLNVLDSEMLSAVRDDRVLAGRVFPECMTGGDC
jgi:hypothetical protein